MSPTQKHSLWKRVCNSIEKEIPIIEKFNMYGFINGEPTDIYETLKTENYKGMVKMIDFTMFGLRYPFDNTRADNILKYLQMIKESDNYKNYLKDYVVSEPHFKALQEVALKYNIVLQNDSEKYKKSIELKYNDRTTSIRSTTLEEDIKKIISIGEKL